MVPIVLNFPFTVVEQITIGFGIAVVCECKIKPRGDPRVGRDI
jgi:hypothetical protein